MIKNHIQLVGTVPFQNDSSKIILHELNSFYSLGGNAA